MEDESDNSNRESEALPGLVDVESLAGSLRDDTVCSTGEPESSHVLRAMVLSPRDAQGTIRVSLGHKTRVEHIENTVRALKETVARLREISSMRGAAE